MTTLPVAPGLERGVNLSHWYGQVYMDPGYRPEHYDDYMRDSDLDLIVSMGFDHVRFPLSLEHLATPSGELKPDFADRVLREVDRLHRRGLVVVVDLHPENEYKEELARSDEAVAVFLRTWSVLAARLANTDPDRIVLEVLNEPGIGDASRWANILTRAIESIRGVATDHRIVVAGDRYSQVPELLKLPPLSDPRLVYNFHLYDPVAFTHQGAGWSPEWVQGTRGLAYPTDAANIGALLADTDDPASIAELQEYEARAWGPALYGDLVETAAAFAAARNVPLICNEFGVYQRWAPRQSRLRWLSDVVDAFRSHGVGWTIWDYAGEFAVAVGDRGDRHADEEVAAALGLR